jgi:phosphoglycolate phosphatase-like HAD superfamily hydrolase
MHPIANYDVYIFDCDGVILDSNQLKIDAMRNALELIVNDSLQVSKCVDYFRNNFGRSRFHHIDVFVEQFLLVNTSFKAEVKERILNAYSDQCKSLYLKAELTPGFIDFIGLLKGKKYIASGSEQQELRDVFTTRKLDTYFNDIYGSPTKKLDLVANILTLNSDKSAVMFGDALSDLEASQLNDIDFIAYTPFSNVPEELATKSQMANFRVIKAWSEI